MLERTVEIELSLKGGQFGLHKESRHDAIDKLVLVVNDKASTMWLPRHDMLQTFLCHGVKEQLELFRKRSRHDAVATGPRSHELD